MHFFKNLTHSIGYLPIAVSAAKTKPLAPLSKEEYISLLSALVGKFELIIVSSKLVAI